MLGEAKNKKAYIYTHYMFTLTYNKDRVRNITLCDWAAKLIHYNHNTKKIFIGGSGELVHGVTNHFFLLR